MSITLALGRAPPSEHAERARASSASQDGRAFFSYAASTLSDASQRALRLFTEGTAHCAWLPARSALPSFLQMIPPILLNSSVPRRVSNEIAFILLTDESCALRRIRQRSSRRPQRSGNVSLIKENISSPSAGYCLPAPFRMSPPSVMDPCLTSHSGEYSKEKCAFPLTIPQKSVPISSFSLRKSKSAQTQILSKSFTPAALRHPHALT